MKVHLIDRVNRHNILLFRTLKHKTEIVRMRKLAKLANMTCKRSIGNESDAKALIGFPERSLKDFSEMNAIRKTRTPTEIAVK